MAGAPLSDIDAIRAARAANNAAIAARDLAAMQAAYLPDYTVITGSAGTVLRDGTQVAARMAAGVFSDPAFITYVRTPDEITIATPRLRAMERGHWTGRWRGTTLTGQYLAVWLPVADGWKLRSESFVTLSGVEAN